MVKLARDIDESLAWPFERPFWHVLLPTQLCYPSCDNVILRGLSTKKLDLC